MSNSF